MKKFKCIKCNEIKDEIEFHYDLFRGYDRFCKICSNFYEIIWRNEKDREQSFIQ